MIVNDLVSQFYTPILANDYILIACYPSVDAVCALKILQSILTTSSVHYSTVPVVCEEDLLQVIDGSGDGGFTAVVMLNCGAQVDVTQIHEKLGYEVKFYIFDSLRPFLLENLYSPETLDNQNVLCFANTDEEVEVPKFEEVFWIENQDENEEPSTSSNLEQMTREQIKNRKYKRWLDAREDAKFQYYMFSYTATPAAFLMFKLAMKLSRDTTENLWWTILAVTDYFLTKKISKSRYEAFRDELAGRVTLKGHQRQRAENISVDFMAIREVKRELKLTFYKKWSVFESLHHTLDTACALRTGQQYGNSVKKFLAALGLPICDSKEPFSAMHPEYQKGFRGWVLDNSERFYLQDLIFDTFEARLKLNVEYSASDMAQAIAALLSVPQGCVSSFRTPDARFMHVLGSLQSLDSPCVKSGVELWKSQLKIIFGQLRSVISQKQVIGGAFLHASVLEEHVWLSSSPQLHSLFASYVLQAYVYEHKGRPNVFAKARSLSLILASPLTDQNPENGSLAAPTDGGPRTAPEWQIISGVPPLDNEAEGNRNLFPALFEKALSGLDPAKFKWCCFDRATIHLRTNYKERFFTQLNSLMLE